MNAPIKTAHQQADDAFHRLIHENHMYGLWEIASQMTPQPRPEAVPHQWKWSLLDQVAKQSATASLSYATGELKPSWIAAACPISWAMTPIPAMSPSVPSSMAAALACAATNTSS